MAASPVGRRRSGRRLLLAGVVIMLVALRVLLVLRTTDGDNGPPATAPETSTGATATSVPSDAPAVPTTPTQTGSRRPSLPRRLRRRSSVRSPPSSVR